MYRVIVLLCTIHVSYGSDCNQLQIKVDKLQQQISVLQTIISNDRAATAQYIHQLLELEKLSSPSKMSRRETFDRLGTFINQLASIQCNIEASEIVNGDSYKLTYDLPINLAGDDIEVKMNNRVIYVKGSKGGTVVFEHVELLPAALDAKSADWQLQGDKIEIFIPFNKTQTGTKRDPCKADNNSTITVQESSPLFSFRRKINVY